MSGANPAGNLPPGVTDRDTDGPPDRLYPLDEVLDRAPADVRAVAETSLYLSGAPEWRLEKLMQHRDGDGVRDALEAAWSFLAELDARGFAVVPKAGR